MSNVYVVQDNSRMDFSPAEEFGPIKKMLFREHTQVYYESTEAINRVHAQLKDFTSEDYLLLNGDPVLIGIAIAVAADYCDGQIQLLKFDRREHRYLIVKISDIFNKEGIASHR